jgi:hypothetical protein
VKKQRRHTIGRNPSGHVHFKEQTIEPGRRAAELPALVFAGRQGILAIVAIVASRICLQSGVHQNDTTKPLLRNYREILGMRLFSNRRASRENISQKEREWHWGDKSHSEKGVRPYVFRESDPFFGVAPRRRL